MLRPDVVKIDVEGAELKVLEGARETLKEARPILLIEGGAKAAITSYLRGFHYVPLSYDANRDELCSFREPSLNTFFIPGTTELTPG